MPGSGLVVTERISGTSGCELSCVGVWNMIYLYGGRVDVGKRGRVILTGGRRMPCGSIVFMG